MTDYQIVLPVPHKRQLEFLNSPAKRLVIRAGRRSGKTVGMSIRAVQKFLAGRRVLYATPTNDQIQRFWAEVTRALSEPIKAGIFKANQTEHSITLVGSEQRIRAKTAYNSDSLRGDYADELILDEYQLMDESAWEEVGAPMLLDNNGNATFIYTPPSLHSHSASKARDPQHAAKMFQKALADTSGRWAAFHFTSHENPYISKVALSEITKDMTALAIRQEINAEDIDEAPGALWHRRKTLVGPQEVLGLEDNRVFQHPRLIRVGVGVDPSGSATGDACGIIGVGLGDNQHHYTLADKSIQGSPDIWAHAGISLYVALEADIMVAEKNYGGEMVEKVIKDTVIAMNLEIDKDNVKRKDANLEPMPHIFVNVKLVSATRGKDIRAEPISAMTERGEDHLVGDFPELEDELCLWVQGDKSPNRLDAKVWIDTELGGGASWLMF